MRRIKTLDELIERIAHHNTQYANLYKRDGVEAAKNKLAVKELEEKYPMALSMRHNLKMFLGMYLHDAQKLAAKNLHTIRVVVQNNACLCDDDEIREDRINVIVESYIIIAVLGIA